MKILIIGKQSYIGLALQRYLQASYEIEMLSSRDEQWESLDFRMVDVIIYLEAIVHINPKRVSEETYMRVNCRVPIMIAQKAKENHVKQFIYMSSMAVYGIDGKIGKPVVIDIKTPCKPISKYGRSKLAAEEGLLKLADERFTISLVRAPMVYGPGCKGNYVRLSNMVKMIRIFPDMHNQRSMIYISNLCECIHLIIHRRIAGIICPQDDQYINTTKLAVLIADANHIKLRRSRVLAWVISHIGGHVSACNKAFGNLMYDKNMSQLKETEYAKVTTEEAIRETERIHGPALCEGEFR